MLRRAATALLGTSRPVWCHPAAVVVTTRAAASDSKDAISSMEEAASRHDLESVLSIVESGESFDGATVAAALMQVEKCTRGMEPGDLQRKLHGTKTFQMLADMAVSSAGHAAPDVLASTIGVLGRLNFQDEMVYDSLARHLMPGVKQLSAEHMQDMVEGLQRAEHSPSVLLLDEVHERLSAMQHSVPHEQARAVEEGLQSLGRQPDNLPNQPGDQEQPDRIKYT